jgi:hypothetical protein
MSVKRAPEGEHTVTLCVSEQVAQHLESLSTIGDGLDAKLSALLEAEYGRRLSRYSLTDRLMAQKYGMAFTEFERQKTTESQGYSWDVESDAIEWDMAISGIRTMQRKLSELLEAAPHGHR